MKIIHKFFSKILIYFTLITIICSKNFIPKNIKSFLEKDNPLNEEIILSPDMTYSSGFKAFSPTYFRIKLDDTSNIKMLSIYFTVLSGNADMYVYSDSEHKNLIEKKNFRYVYKKEIIEITEDFLQNYYISITLHESSYIEIKYDTNANEKKYALINNQVNIEYLNKEEEYKTYSIKTEVENNYILIQSMDCSLSFNSGGDEEKNITYKYLEFSGKEYEFNLKLENYFHSVINNKEDCTVFISTGTKDNANNDPLIIPESVPNPSSLINTYYNFPFFYDESFKGIFININLDSESIIQTSSYPEIKITFIVGDQQSDYETHTIKKSKLFFIKSNVEKYCKNKNDICNLKINIEKVDSSKLSDTYKIYTTLQLSSLSPVCIDKNQLYTEKILPMGSQYFYTQIDEYEEGEINIMFNKGSGKIFAKIVEKDNFEKNPNWNRRIELPTEESSDLLEVDYNRGSLKYFANSKYNNCTKGCELYILVKGNEIVDNESMLNDFSFSIDKKRKDIEQNGVVNLNLNNYVKGNMTKNVYKYYTFTIDFDIKKISINFYGQYGRAYIKLGKGHIANEQNYDWELIRKNRLVISSNDEKIEKNSLKGLSFSIGITTLDTYMKLNDDNLNDYYFLQIQTLHDDEIDYYYLHSERSISCNTNSNNYCRIFIPLSNLNDNKDTLVYAQSTINDKNTINICAKFYSEDEFDKISYTESISEKFPTNENNDQNSNNMKYLLLDNSKIVNNNYVLITIYSNEKSDIIKVILSPSSNLLRTSLPPLTERLMWVNYQQKINFTVLEDKYPSRKVYTMNLQTLTGTAELYLGENDYYPEIDGNYVNEISPDNKTPMKINNNNSNKEPIAMIISYSNTISTSPFEYNVYKNTNNEISFSLSQIPSRQFQFFELNKNSIKMNIYFYDIQFKEYSRSYTDKNIFDIYAMVIPDSGDTFDIHGNYLIFEGLGVIDLMLNRGELIEGENLVYSFIDKNYQNENEYKKIKEQITISEINDNNEIILFPKSKYFYSLDDNLDNKVNLILTNKIQENKIILVDIVENIPVSNNLKYVFKQSDDSIIEKYNTYDYMGKKRILIDISEFKDKSIKLSIEKEVNGTAPNNFTLQYFPLLDESSIFEYKEFDNNFIMEESKNKNLTSFSITFKNILHYNTSISKVSYFIDVFNKTDDFNSYDKISTQFLGNGKHQNKVYGKIIEWLSSDYENYTLSVFRSELDVEDMNKCLVRIVASFTNENGIEERILYTLKKEEEKKESGNSFTVFIYFSIALVVISVIVIIIFCTRNKGKDRPSSTIKNQKIEPISNLEDSKTDELLEVKQE
mgnify:CR=1 FL=1